MFSAFCFVIANSLGIAVIVQDALSPSYNEQDLHSLNVDYIIDRWEHRRYIAPLQQTSHVFNLMGWLFMVIPILQLTWALSYNGKRKIGTHTAIATLAIAGCMTEVLARLLSFGLWGAARWLSEGFQLSSWKTSGQYDGFGWKSLEINYFIMDGLLDWVDAFEWICLFGILILLYYSIGTQPKEQRILSMWWVGLGLIIAFFSFVDFSADLLRLEEWRSFAQIAIFVAILNTCFFLPVWLLWLACTMRHVMPNSSEIEYSTSTTGTVADQIRRHSEQLRRLSRRYSDQTPLNIEQGGGPTMYQA